LLPHLPRRKILRNLRGNSEKLWTSLKFRILFAAKSKEFEELRMEEIAAISRENDRVVKELSKRIGTTERDLYSIKDAVRELKKETSGIMKEFPHKS
jgi:hypothetical protein